MHEIERLVILSILFTVAFFILGGWLSKPYRNITQWGNSDDKQAARELTIAAFGLGMMVSVFIMILIGISVSS